MGSRLFCTPSYKIIFHEIVFYYYKKFPFFHSIRLWVERRQAFFYFKLLLWDETIEMLYNAILVLREYFILFFCFFSYLSSMMRAVLIRFASMNIRNHVHKHTQLIQRMLNTICTNLLVLNWVSNIFGSVFFSFTKQKLLFCKKKKKNRLDKFRGSFCR